MPTFNLVHEQWIPCQMASGPPRELSLHHVIEQAGEVRSITADSPLATAAIHRLLLAILLRSGLPTDEGGWYERWRARDIGADVALVYLDRWAERFDLFDSTCPFYQTAGLAPEYANTIAKLTHELNAGNNGALFDHSLDDAPRGLAPAAAACALVATQAFAPGGLLSYEKGRLQDKSADAAPLVKGAVVLVTGDTLAETLLLNAFRTDGVRFPNATPDDSPAWEREQPTEPADRYPQGPLDILTWQARRVLLFPVERDGLTVVERAVIMKGFQFPTSRALAENEPMLAFRINRKPPLGQDPESPIGFRTDRAVWRDSLALLLYSEPKDERDGCRPPRSVVDLSERYRADDEPGNRLMVLGLGVDRAKLLLWRHEELPFSPQYLTNDGLATALERAVLLAEDVSGRLRSATMRLAEVVLSPATAKPDRKRLSALVDSLAPNRSYWAGLDASFRELMAELPGAYGEDQGRTALSAWRDAVRDAANDAFDEVARAIESNARGLRAAAEARGMFGALLGRQLNEFTSSLPEEVIT